MLGAINHIALSVTDLEISDKFWFPLFEFLGYKKTVSSDTLSVWESVSTGSAINFWLSKEKQKYLYDAPGLHHVAFHAKSKSDVDDCFDLLQTYSVKILESPNTYNQYEPGYYAVFFQDINGFKIELAYTPSVIRNRQ
jgi:catechol 2,3-dioxygenase-like lactoylglutathione lyase family enzyme